MTEEVSCVYVMTMITNQPITLLSDHIHTFATCLTVCSPLVHLSLYVLY